MRIIGGFLKGRKLSAPRSQTTRPTTGALREALFNICRSKIEDAAILDLFAGTGAIGLEAISRGARHATLIENGKEAIQCIKNNISSLNLEKQVHVIPHDVCNSISRFLQNRQFDIIYADPPFKGQSVEEQFTELLEIIDKSEVLSSRGTLFIESPHKFPPNVRIESGLACENSRKYGKAYLHIYTKAAY